MSKVSIIAILALTTAGESLAGDLVSGATVTKVSNTSNNAQNFSIYVTGGTSNICTGGWITFPVSAAADAEAHKRAYAAALLALTTGMPVRIHNYQSDNCNNASYIELG